MSFAGLFVLAGLAAFVFLAVLGLITLLTSPKTRDTAKILLGGLAAIVLLVVLVGGMFVGVARTRAIALQENAHQDVVREIEHLEQVKRQVEMGESLPSSTIDLEETSPSVAPSPDATDEEAEEVASTDEAVAPADADTSAGEDKKATAEVVEAVEETAAPPEEPEESDFAELSVAPLADDNRPDWVDGKPYKKGSVYYWPVAADPRADADEAEFEALPEALNGAVADYIDAKMRLGSDASRQVHLSPDYVRNVLVGKDIWVEPRSLSVGEFVRIHALIKFDREANLVIREQWDQQRVALRIWSAGGFLAMVLFFLALIYCYLKIDQVTDGSRRGLLRFAAILVILGLMLVAAGVASVGIA